MRGFRGVLGRILGPYRSLDHMLAREGVWIAPRGDIPRHWAKTHPATGQP